jgi:protein-disulfide isomerase
MRARMKQLSAALLLLLLCASASAAMVDVAALRAYAKGAISRCPDAVVTIEPILQSGPMNFLVYDVTVKSKDENCATRKYLLFSPSTQQVILGTAFVLPQDGRPLNVRLSEHSSELLKQPVMASVAAFPLPDGLKAVTLTKQTPYGPFSYHGYVDGSERFMIVGMRGNLRIPPSTTLRDVLNAASAARRGNKKARVEVLELSDFECPTCARAHEKIDPLIEKNLSKINFGRLDLPLFEHHEWALPAAVGGRAILKVAPAKYWAYVDFMFRNQEQIGKTKFDKVIQDFCEDNGVPWAKVQPIYNSPAERQAMLEQVSRAFDNNVNATPTFIVNGQMTDFGPEGATVMKAIKDALAGK